jgi:Putative serine esterase (DUF676)
MDGLLPSIFPSSSDWYKYEYPLTTASCTMTGFGWIFLVTLLLVAALGESWLPARMSRLRHRIRERQRRRRAIGNETSSDDEQNQLSLLPWWEDSWSEALLNSFPLSPLSSSASTGSAESAEAEFLAFQTYTPNPDAQVLHFCFLLHGHRGFSTDLSYLQRVMQHHAELNKRDNTQQQDMLVHCSVCNEGKTTDGVVNGGERMVLEILQVIRQELQRRREEGMDRIQDITISIVGNSLGGVYGRYAIAKLADYAAEQENHPELHSTNNSNITSANATNNSQVPSWVLLDGIRLHFNIFCTTATPHLGISKHTYVPLPRSVEIGAAHVLGETGRDLFRLNDVMKNMATCPTYLEPLRKFRKRVAYANAYATDFPVPATTAAFLSDQSTYPHHFATSNNSATSLPKTQDGNQQAEGEESKYVVATLHTHAAKTLPNYPTKEHEAIVDDLVQMSNSLDSLGWKKVFIDIRKEIPLQVTLPKSLNIRKNLNRTSMLLTPKILRRGASSAQSSFSEDGKADDDSTQRQQQLSSDEEEEAPLSAIHRLRQKGVVESRDVASLVSTPEDMKISAPIGHNLMVALSREGISGGLYKAGRPVMDLLAKELVHDIFDWNFQEETNVAEKTLERQKIQ